MTLASVGSLWVFGLACLTVACLGSAVKVSGFELPAAAKTPARVGISAIGLVSLLLGTVLFLRQDSDSTATSGAQPATGSGHPSTTVQSMAAATATTPAATSGTQDAAAVLWHGKVRLDNGTGVDVGEIPISVESENTLATSFWMYEGQALSGQSGNNLLSEWTAAGDPTAEQCAERLRTQPIERIKGYRAGLRICVHGLFDKRVGYAKVLSYDGHSSQVDIVVWATQLD